MPRNPHKKPCQVPGCNAWAMRDHDLCRAHRDDELGPRGAGAPSGNLNALKHGRHSHPLPQPDLERLVGHVLDAPADLPYHVGLAARSLQARVGDPVGTLVALRRLLSQLADLLARRLLSAELRSLLDALPPEAVDRVCRAFAKAAPRRDPVETLRFVRALRKQLLEEGPFAGCE